MTSSGQEATRGAAPQSQAPAPSTEARLETLYPDDLPKDGEPASAGKPASVPNDNVKLAAEKAPAKSEQEQKGSEQQGDVEPYRLALPDGLEVDHELLAQATPVLREAGLTNDQVGKLAPLVETVQSRLLDSQESHFTELRAHWAKQAKADPQVGGARWRDSIRLAALALEAGGAFKGSEARKLLDESGLGNHPAFIRLFSQLGERLTAAGVGPTAHQTRLNGLARIYPNDTPKGVG